VVDACRYGANAAEAPDDVRRRGRRRRMRGGDLRRDERGRGVGRRLPAGRRARGEEAAAERGAGADAGEELRAREQAGAGAQAAAGARAGPAAAAGGHLVPEPARAVEGEAAGEGLRRAEAPARRRQGRQRRPPLPQQEAPSRGLYRPYQYVRTYNSISNCVTSHLSARLIGPRSAAAATRGRRPGSRQLRA
jgi:hypothetical protein